LDSTFSRLFKLNDLGAVLKRVFSAKSGFMEGIPEDGVDSSSASLTGVVIEGDEGVVVSLSSAEATASTPSLFFLPLCPPLPG
jgi:hypothetical protein